MKGRMNDELNFIRILEFVLIIQFYYFVLLKN